MSDAISDLRRARDAAIHDRREHGRRLGRLKSGDSETMIHLIRSQHVIDALDAAIAHEEAELRRGPVTVIDLDDAPGG